MILGFSRMSHNITNPVYSIQTAHITPWAVTNGSSLGEREGPATPRYRNEVVAMADLSLAASLLLASNNYSRLDFRRQPKINFRSVYGPKTTTPECRSSSTNFKLYAHGVRISVGTIYELVACSDKRC